VGAGIGVYKNFAKKEVSSHSAPSTLLPDLHANLLKLADLREKGILTESEFEMQKRKVLKGEA
jgi:hypothetical protein